MKNKFLLAAFLSVPLLIAPNVKAASFTDNQTVDTNKRWTIKFTGDVGFDDLTKQGITVIDGKGNKIGVGIQIGQDNKTVTVTAPQGGYTSGESYTLDLGTNTHSTKGKTLKKEYLLHFNVKSNAPTATVEQVGTAIMGKIVIVASLPSNVDASQYDVKLDGKALTYNKTTKKFTIILDGTFTKEQLQAKIAVAEHSVSDETKPTVLSASIIDSTTLRMQFSEAVKYAYATNVDNYELKDANGINIMDKSGVYIKASSDVDEKAKADTDTYDIKVDKAATSTYKFDSSKYTLTVSDIIDTAAYPNKIDDQTIAVDGSNNIQINVEAFKNLDSDKKVVIYFDSAMDTSSITDKNNYYYINGDGDAEALPDNIDITASSDNKSVVLNFDDANKTVNPSAISGADVVKKIGVKIVKDASGNEICPGVLTIASAATNSLKLEENTFKLYKNGDAVKAEFLLNSALDTVNVADFKISGIAADDAETDGDKVTLTFNEGDKANAILALGSAAVLQISSSSVNPSEDIGGRTIAAATQKVYYNNIAPETDRNNYKAEVTVDASGNVTGAQVYITLKTPVDVDILGAYKDDFLLTNITKGTNLEVESVKLAKLGTQSALVYTIKGAATKVVSGDKIDIVANPSDENIDLRSEEDGYGNNTRFVPTSDDLMAKTVKVIKINQ